MVCPTLSAGVVRAELINLGLHHHRCCHAIRAALLAIPSVEAQILCCRPSLRTQALDTERAVHEAACLRCRQRPIAEGAHPGPDPRCSATADSSPRPNLTPSARSRRTSSEAPPISSGAWSLRTPSRHSTASSPGEPAPFLRCVLSCSALPAQCTSFTGRRRPKTITPKGLWPLTYKWHVTGTCMR